MSKEVEGQLQDQDNKHTAEVQKKRAEQRTKDAIGLIGAFEKAVEIGDLITGFDGRVAAKACAELATENKIISLQKLEEYTKGKPALENMQVEVWDKIEEAKKLLQVIKDLDVGGL